MAQVFRPEALEELFLIEESMVESLIVEFKNSAPKLVEQISKCRAASDFKGMEIASHSLKSSCLVLGLQKAGEYCYQMERASSQKQPGIEDTVTLTGYISEAVEELENYVRSRNT